VAWQPTGAADWRARGGCPRRWVQRDASSSTRDATMAVARARPALNVPTGKCTAADGCLRVALTVQGRIPCAMAGRHIVRSSVHLHGVGIAPLLGCGAVRGVCSESLAEIFVSTSTAALAIGCIGGRHNRLRRRCSGSPIQCSRRIGCLVARSNSSTYVTPWAAGSRWSFTRLAGSAPRRCCDTWRRRPLGWDCPDRMPFSA
jgi:hypothetical protein